MKLNTNISLENIVTIIALICSVTLAFGFMQYDIDLLKKELDLKADERQVVADRELIAYKLDVIMQDIEEIKQTFAWLWRHSNEKDKPQLKKHILNVMGVKENVKKKSS